VAAINAAFRPSPEAADRAGRIVAAARDHGAGAFRLDGEMVDAPVIRRARAVLAAETAFSTAPVAHEE
jgi:citrate lyase beta subunit